MKAPVLTGEDFVLSAPELDDAAVWLAGEDPEQMRWFEAPGPASIEGVADAIRKWRAAWAGNGPTRHWGIRVDGHLAGGVELHLRPDGKANVSYVVFPQARGRGLASEALRLATQWAFSELGVLAVVAVIDELNDASRRTAARAGFVLDGRAEPWEFSESGVMLRYVIDRPGSRSSKAS